jgi:hypothetical protein
MVRSTIGLGILLIILGLIGFFATGMQSVTALIPTFFGIVFIISGFIARKESARKMMMHIAMVIGLLGLIGSFPGLIKLFPLMTGTEVGRPAAVIAQSIMALSLIYYLGMGIKTFIDARKSD